MHQTEGKLVFTDWDKVPAELLKKFLKEHCLFFVLNANDTFYYASADCTTVDDTDMWKALEMYQKYGACGVDAFQAHLRKEDVLPPLQFPDYKKAKEELKTFVRFEDQEV